MVKILYGIVHRFLWLIFGFIGAIVYFVAVDETRISKGHKPLYFRDHYYKKLNL